MATSMLSLETQSEILACVCNKFVPPQILQLKFLPRERCMFSKGRLRSVLHDDICVAIFIPLKNL